LNICFFTLTGSSRDRTELTRLTQGGPWFPSLTTSALRRHIGHRADYDRFPNADIRAIERGGTSAPEALRAHWKSISNQHPHVEDISVIGIDLTKRFD
jgi:hypothetical protein